MVASEDRRLTRSMKLSEMTEIPELEGQWVGLTEAAEILGISRQYAYKKASLGAFSTLRRVGSAPMFVVNRAELHAGDRA